MKKVAFILILLSLIGCESSSNKASRLTIEKYSRKLSSMIGNIVESRKEEGNQSLMTLNNFFERYTSSFESYINDLNFENITPKYTTFRDDLILTSKQMLAYLNLRRTAIRDLSETFSSYESAYDNANEYFDYMEKMRSSSYSRSLYLEYAYESLSKSIDESYEFLGQRENYFKDILMMDSICIKLDSIVVSFNLKTEKTSLQERLLFPVTFRDTINDWLLSGKEKIKTLQIPDVK